MSDLAKRLRTSAEMLQPGSEPEVALRVAADEIERLTAERQDALDSAAEAQLKAERLVDLPICRLQFPDGTVPGCTEDALTGWHRIAYRALRERDEARADWKQAEANGEAFVTERDEARALFVGIQTFVTHERALRDSLGKGGQSCGRSPSMTVTTLRDLERLIRDAPEVAQHCADEFARLTAERDRARALVIACEDHLNAARNYAYDSRSDRDECDVLLRAIAELDGRKTP